MSTKISELPSATSLTTSDEVPIVQTGTTKKATIGQIKSVDYSTTEQVIGTWINGKPLYEKTYSVTVPVVTTSGNWASSKYAMPTNFEYAFVNMAVIKDTANQYLQTPFITLSGYIIKCYIGVENGSWVIVSSNYSGVSNCAGYVTIRYTKTTDSAS